MKITLSKEEFLKNLIIGGKYANVNKVMPILADVKLAFKGSHLDITSNDNENAVSVRMTLDYPVTEEVSFCVAFNELMNYVKLIPSDTFDIEVESNTITIMHSKGNYTLPAESAAEFPQVIKEDDMKKFTIDAHMIYDAIVFGTDFTWKDQLRAAFFGIYMYVEGNKFGYCATDASVLVHNDFDFKNEMNEDFSFILPQPALSGVKELASKNETLNIKLGSKTIMFNGGNVFMSSRLPEGRFVNFKSVLEKTKSSYSVRVNKGEILHALQRVALASDKKNGLIKLNILPESIGLVSEDLNLNKAGKESVSCEGDCTLSISTKYDNIMKVISNIVSENVLFELSNETNPIIVKNAEDNGNYISLSMPMVSNN